MAITTQDHYSNLFQINMFIFLMEDVAVLCWISGLQIEMQVRDNLYFYHDCSNSNHWISFSSGITSSNHWEKILSKYFIKDIIYITVSIFNKAVWFCCYRFKEWIFRNSEKGIIDKSMHTKQLIFLSTKQPPLSEGKSSLHMLYSHLFFCSCCRHHDPNMSRCIRP